MLCGDGVVLYSVVSVWCGVVWCMVSGWCGCMMLKYSVMVIGVVVWCGKYSVRGYSAKYYCIVTVWMDGI